MRHAASQEVPSAVVRRDKGVFNYPGAAHEPTQRESRKEVRAGRRPSAQGCNCVPASSVTGW